MTWSMIARDDETGRVGIIAATCFFAVGALVPHIKTGVGAVASQAFINPFYGPQGLALLQAGASAEDTIKFLTGGDEGREHRQLHVMDRQGQFAAFTGEQCVEWCGHRIGSTYSIAGNMLANGRVVDDTAAAYEARLSTPFARRLIAAMHAGERAGGDKRGKQSAALLIHDEQDYPLLNLRVDDHSDPLAELSRLEAVARERFLHFRRMMPSRDNPSGFAGHPDLDDRIAASIAEKYE